MKNTRLTNSSITLGSFSGLLAGGRYNESFETAAKYDHQVAEVSTAGKHDINLKRGEKEGKSISALI